VVDALAFAYAVKAELFEMDPPRSRWSCSASGEGVKTEAFFESWVFVVALAG
jgi:hypothetical protein